MRRGQPKVVSIPESHAPAIETRGLKKTYEGGVEAVKGVDLEVAPGEMFGLLGPNGAGKSTLVGMLTCTIAPSGGSARLAGFDVAREPIAARRISSVVFQEAVVDRDLSGRSNLELHARLWAVPPEAAAARLTELVDTFGLSQLIDRPVDGYSGGERRRLEIARALVSEPRILFLDEPTVGLDPRVRRELLDVIAGLRARNGMTTLLTTHYLEEAERLCDRIAIIHQGEVVALDTPETLLADLGREIVELRIDGGGDGAAALALLRARGVAGEDAFSVGASLTVPLHDRTPADVVGALGAAGLGSAQISTRTPSLDDVYLRLTGDRLSEAA